jgi:hypothetical protein
MKFDEKNHLKKMLSSNTNCRIVLIAYDSKQKTKIEGCKGDSRKKITIRKEKNLVALKKTYENSKNLKYYSPN